MPGSHLDDNNLDLNRNGQHLKPGKETCLYLKQQFSHFLQDPRQPELRPCSPQSPQFESSYGLRRQESLKWLLRALALEVTGT